MVDTQTVLAEGRVFQDYLGLKRLGALSLLCFSANEPRTGHRQLYLSLVLLATDVQRRYSDLPL
jgi:hypothetical protein